MQSDEAKGPDLPPYALEILSPDSPGCGSGSWRWAIRRNGRVYQRSDRSYPTEAKARSDGAAMLDRVRSGADPW